ncbi:MAG: type II toxin-antitoxin system ParD family antitoxin [Bacteroidota bacterium]
MKKLNVTITDEQKALVERVIADGRFASASEVVRDGLRLFTERELLREAKLSELRRLVQNGLQSGPAGPWDVDEIKAFARERAAARVATREPAAERRSTRSGEHE